MLHGHTKIELKNEKTGELQVVEKDNMITNILSKQLGDCAIDGYSTLNNRYFPLNNLGMGGILLFQEALDEDVNSYRVPNPNTNPIIGCANNAVNDGTDTKRGSRNLTESQQLENGYKFVWDFNTSQGNGQISAIGLTHNNIGASDYQIQSNYIQISGNWINSDLLNYSVKMDWDNDILIAIYTSTTDNTSYIRKYKLSINNVGVNGSLCSGTLISEEKLANAPENNITWFDGNDNYYYGFTGKSQGTAITLYRMNKSTYEIDSSYTTNISLSTSNDVVPQACYLNGYIYVFTTPRNVDTTTMYVAKINASDTSIVTQQTLTGLPRAGTGYGRISCCVPDKDRIHVGKVFVYEDLTWSIRLTNVTAFCGASFDNGYGPFQHGFVNSDNFRAIAFAPEASYKGPYMYVTHFINYLATINNLDSPVTKTSEQSMKITYTITEE